jgi:hypothetical protein
MESRTILTAAGILVVAITAAIIFQRQYAEKVWYMDEKLLEKGTEKPTIWLYVDDTDVNSRWWADFGARSSRVYNLPFLNLCYQTIISAAGSNYQVQVIGGIADAERRLGGLPRPMRNKRLPLRDEERTYLRIAFLEKFGGLWMNPATICVRSLPVLPADKVVMFGSDPLETYAGKEGTFMPNQHAMWSPHPAHPFFQNWHNILATRIDEQHTGKEIRYDKNWDALLVGTGRQDIIMMPNAELTRKKTGRKIELEDLLAAGTEGVLPFDIPAETIYVPFPWPEVLERRMFGWFLRMSEEQVMSSDLSVRWLFEMAGI